MSSRERSPWRSTVIQYTNRLTGSHCPYASIACSGLPRRPLPLPPRNDKECVVIARAKPVAIHCDPVSEETSRTCNSKHDGLPRPSLRSLLAMTTLCSLPFLSPPCHREGRKPVATHFATASGSHPPNAPWQDKRVRNLFLN